MKRTRRMTPTQARVLKSLLKANGYARTNPKKRAVKRRTRKVRRTRRSRR